MTHLQLDDARRGLGLSMMDLWVDFFGLGGTFDVFELDRYLRGDRDVSDTDHNVVVHALNEVFSERGHNHPLAYRSI